MRKYLLILLLLLLSLTALAGCNTTGTAESSTPGGTTTVPGTTGCVHEVDFVWGTPATCTEPGTTDYGVCTLCGEVIAEREVIPALGHRTSTPVPGQFPTCTESGLTDGMVCDYCGEYTTQEVIPALGHEAQEFFDNDDCSHWKTCVRCDFRMVEAMPHELDALGRCTVCEFGCEHKNSEWYTEREATCTEPGIMKLHCLDCGSDYSEQPIGELPHDYKNIPEIPPTCTADGVSAGVVCARCDYSLVACQTIPATGHNQNFNPSQAPTCTEPGTTEGISCDMCGYTTVEVIPALGHRWEGIYDADENGHWKICSYCGIAMGEIESHSYEDMDCTVCDYRCKHNNTHLETVEGSCTQDGWTDQHCDDCAAFWGYSYEPAGHIDNNADDICDRCGESLI